MRGITAVASLFPYKPVLRRPADPWSVKFVCGKFITPSQMFSGYAGGYELHRN
jgi:hypothetical protein